MLPWRAAAKCGPGCAAIPQSIDFPSPSPGFKAANVLDGDEGRVNLYAKLHDLIAGNEATLFNFI